MYEFTRMVGSSNMWTRVPKQHELGSLEGLSLREQLRPYKLHAASCSFIQLIWLDIDFIAVT